MNVLIEMTALAIARPLPDSDAEAVAGWYEKKSRLHEFLAAEPGPDSVHERALAASARARSMRIRQAIV